MRLVYSSRALAQLASVHEYLVRRNPAGARNVARSIRQTIARLTLMPLLGKLTDEQDVRVLIELCRWQKRLQKNASQTL